MEKWVRQYQLEHRKELWKAKRNQQVYIKLLIDKDDHLFQRVTALYKEKRNDMPQLKDLFSTLKDVKADQAGNEEEKSKQIESQQKEEPQKSDKIKKSKRKQD